MDELIVIGEVIKPQGVKGEVKIKPFTDDLFRFEKLKAVFVNTAFFKILSARVSPPFVFLRLNGIDDRTQAEALRGKFLSIDRVNAVIPDEGAYFIADIKGCTFFIDGQEAGTVGDVLQHGAADVFVVKLKSGKTVMFPFLNSLNLKMDTENKKIYADKKALDGVAVYED